MQINLRDLQVMPGIRPGICRNDAAAFAANKPLNLVPDSEWYYSSGTANILARIVRHSIGGTVGEYFDFLRRELFTKIGATSAVMEPDPV